MSATTPTEQFAAMVRSARQVADPGFIRSLMSPRPGQVYLTTALIWAQLAGAWALALWGPVWTLPIAFLVLVAVIQGMLLWTHEASHLTLFKDRKKNDYWCDFFFSAPVGMSVATYRQWHNTHHAHFGTDKDEDQFAYFHSVRGWRAALTVIFQTLSGFTGLKMVFTKYLPGANTEREEVPAIVPRKLGLAWTLVFNLALLALAVAAGRWWAYFVFWVYPLLTVSVLLNVIRTTAEHQPVGYPGTEAEGIPMRAEVRTTLPNPVEKWILYQAHFNYHVEHHLFPRVPQHNLALLHRHLAERGFYRMHPGHLQRSGFARFWLLMRGEPGPAGSLPDPAGPVAA